MVTAANPYRDQRTQYDPGMGMDELCDALNLGLYIGVTAPSGSAPTISSAIISFLQSGSGSIARTMQDKAREVSVTPTDKGAAKDDATDDTTAFANALSTKAIVDVPAGTYLKSSTTTLKDGYRLHGSGNRLTVIHNDGASATLATPVSTPGGTKAYYHGTAYVTVKGTSTSVPAAAGLLIQQTGYSHYRDSIIEFHQTAVQLLGAVGTSLDRMTLQQSTNGVRAGGSAGLESTTTTRLTESVITVCTNAIVSYGSVKTFYLNASVIESNTNVYVESGGTIEGFVARSSWFEDNTNFDLGTMVRPVFDTCYFSAPPTITGGAAPVFNEATVAGSDNFPPFRVTTEVADVSVVPTSWPSTQRGQHGVILDMPTIGAASTPTDRYVPQATAQSQLFVNIGSPILACGVGFTNLITDFTSAGQWGNGTGTMTTGQTDIFGGTSAALLSGVDSGTTAYRETIAITVTSGKWYSYQVVLKAATAGNKVQLKATTGSGLDKRISFYLPDTEWRVVHMLFKADAASINLALYHGGGMYVHRIVLAEGSTLRPFVPYNASIPQGFWMEFDSIIIRGTGAPGSGTWRVGDRVLHSTPAAAGNIGWVCTTAGTPGIWKTYGAIAA